MVFQIQLQVVLRIPDQAHDACTPTVLKIVRALQVLIDLPGPSLRESPAVELGPQLPARPAAAQQLVDVCICLYNPQQLQGQGQHSSQPPSPVAGGEGLYGGHDSQQKADYIAGKREG